jgi:hypothetical protein
MADEMQPKETIGANSYAVAEEADALMEDLLANKPVDVARAKAEADLDGLRHEISALREHVAELRYQMRRVVRAQGTSISASAHEQLGDYPWIKLAAAFGATFVLARSARSLPLAALVAALARPRAD